MVHSQDHNEGLQGGTNFSSIALEENWEGRVWPEFKDWAEEMFAAEITEEVVAQSKAVQKKNFGQILDMDGPTGLPLVPSIEELDQLNAKAVQYLQQMVREYLTQHYGQFPKLCG